MLAGDEQQKQGFKYELEWKGQAAGKPAKGRSRRRAGEDGQLDTQWGGRCGNEADTLYLSQETCIRLKASQNADQTSDRRRTHRDETDTLQGCQRQILKFSQRENVRIHNMLGKKDLLTYNAFIQLNNYSHTRGQYKHFRIIEPQETDHGKDPP